jgi:hypothetical protein
VTSIDGSVAAREIPGRGFRIVALYTAHHLELRRSTWIENIPDYETEINAAQKDAQLEKRLTGLPPNPITMEGEQERKSLGALVGTVTGDILARYVKAKNKADDRIGMSSD